MKTVAQLINEARVAGVSPGREALRAAIEVQFSRTEELVGKERVGYLVACTDLHSALLVNSREEALSVVVTMNQSKNDCFYVPVAVIKAS